ncbi:glycosyltransferase family 2 protein [Dietzia sp. B32]|uniref:glycosyltransferase n=1 Tax=Dietzia sp. B32 TaxID=2915130 RepID=UPI0021ADB072|nr:glycosyltransferase [Dietzia sp. B32]UVE96006.1 glycosyltransferase [Dietzia sp. B32]
MEYTGIDVVIPAHDEQDLLAGCLDALADCIAATPVPVTVTVVLDSCSDATEEIARGRARLVRTSARNVGIARARGFDSLRCSSPSSPSSSSPSSSSPSSSSPSSSSPSSSLPAAPRTRRWYATTDADSRVPRSWLTDQLALARAGADVVAGLVEVDAWSDWAPATRLRYLEGYHPGPGHRHIHGANIGLSSEAYRRLGGFDPLPVHEDVRLVGRAQDAGLTVVWSTAAPVTTSSRRSGRAPDGFAAHLAAIEGTLAP